MKRNNIIGILAATAVIVLSVVLISWYLNKRTPMLIQGTVECTTYKASSKVPGRIDEMKVEEGQRVEKGELLYMISTPELDAKLEHYRLLQQYKVHHPKHRQGFFRCSPLLQQFRQEHG